MDTKVQKIVAIIFFLVLLLYAGNTALNLHPRILVSMITLPFHEAGHIFMMPFGEFIHFLGGTLFEIGIPITFLLYFYRKQNLLAEVFTWWWLSLSFSSVALYSGDSISQRLHLIGGGEHDWLYMLGKLRLMNHVDTISGIFVGCALFAMTMMIVAFINYLRS